jgi:hypothetical protein
MPGYFNKQNCRIWAANNPCKLHQSLLHSENVKVWCSISSGGIIGPYFFQDGEGQIVAVKAEWYLAMLETFL